MICNAIKFTATIVGTCALIGGIVFGSGALMCHSQWGDFGKVTWGPMAGCRIELPDGRKLPVSALRDTQLPPAPAASK